MRYTKKITKHYSCKTNAYMWKDNSYNHSRLGIDKLGQLEDIEEELGIDLVKLLSAKSIFVVEKSVFYDFKISVIEQCVYVSVDDCDDTKLSFDDYGKYWAFTKEELKSETTRNDTKRTR